MAQWETRQQGGGGARGRGPNLLLSKLAQWGRSSILEELGQGSGAWGRSSRSEWSQRQGRGRGSGASGTVAVEIVSGANI